MVQAQSWLNYAGKINFLELTRLMIMLEKFELFALTQREKEIKEEHYMNEKILNDKYIIEELIVSYAEGRESYY